MNRVSRRSLARYTAEQLLAGRPVREVAKHLAAALMEAGHEKDAGSLLSDIAWEMESRGKLAIVQVTSATSLSAKLGEELRKIIKKAAKVEAAVLEEFTDKAVIGGIRVETSTRVWDKTVARKLADLREVF